MNKGTFFKVNEGATNRTFSQRAGKCRREVDFAACGPPEGRGWDARSIPLPQAGVVTGLLPGQEVREQGPQAPHVWGETLGPMGSDPLALGECPLGLESGASGLVLLCKRDARAHQPLQNQG